MCRLKQYPIINLFCVLVFSCFLKDKEEADYVEWLKGQADLEGKEEVKDMVSVLLWF